MAIIEQMLMAKSVADLKDASAEFLVSMTDEQLAEYLKDITNLEPEALPLPLGTEVKEPKVKKTKDKSKDESSEPVDSQCPIKSTTKSAKERAKLQALLSDLEGEIE